MTIWFMCLMGLVAVACLAIITTCLVIMALLKRFEVTLDTIKDLERDMFFDVNRMCDIWTDWYTKEITKKDEGSEKKSSRRRHRGGRKHRKNKKLSDDILSTTRGCTTAMISGTDRYEPAASHKKDK